MSKNDERILKLKQAIQEKTEKLGKIKATKDFLTNCVLHYENEIHNLNVLDVEKLTFLLLKMNSLLISEKDLKLDYVVQIDGYSLSEWITDIKNKLNNLRIKSELKELKALETKLSGMLSQDKQKELELDDIEKMLF